MVKKMWQSLLFLKNISVLAIGSWGGKKVASLYETLGSKNHLGEKLDYLNLGYWYPETETLDQACENMADLMGKKAGFKVGGKLLDVGCGFGEQDFFWKRKYDLGAIVALNITDLHIQASQKKCEYRQISGIDFKVGDATRLGFPNASFDFVSALESAFHFRFRDQFFQEAYRVLKPGGRLVMVDLAGFSEFQNRSEKWAQKVGRLFWQIPKENLYPLEEFKKRLQAAGFEVLHAESIWKNVHPPFKKYASRRLEDPEIKNRLNPAYYTLLKSSLKTQNKIQEQLMDYVLVVAEKPT